MPVERPRVLISGASVAGPVLASILTSEPHRPQLPHSSKGRNWDARCDVWPALAPFTIDPAKAWYHSVPSTACLRGGSCLATAMPGPAVSRRRAG